MRRSLACRHTTQTHEAAFRQNATLDEREDVLVDFRPRAFGHKLRHAIRAVEFAIKVGEAGPPRRWKCRGSATDDRLLDVAPGTEPIWIGGPEDRQGRPAAARGEMTGAAVIAENEIDAAEHIDQFIDRDGRKDGITESADAREIGAITTSGSGIATQGDGSRRYCGWRRQSMMKWQSDALGPAPHVDARAGMPGETSGLSIPQCLLSK